MGTDCLRKSSHTNLSAPATLVPLASYCARRFFGIAPRARTAAAVATEPRRKYRRSITPGKTSTSFAGAVDVERSMSAGIFCIFVSSDVNENLTASGCFVYRAVSFFAAADLVHNYTFQEIP